MMRFVSPHVVAPTTHSLLKRTLSHTQTRLENGHYSMHQQVADDVRLVWDNCKNYNQVRIVCMHVCNFLVLRLS